MSELDIIRAWKDKAYRNSLSADELAQLPEHPAGAIELTNDELAHVDGGVISYTVSYTTITVTTTITTITVTTSYVLTYLTYC